MPEYLDFITVFGEKLGPDDHSGRDLRFSSFRHHNALCIQGPATPLLGRRGCQYQMCYNLKTVVSKKNPDTWSIRQAAFHHQFDVLDGTALWISTKGGLEDLKTSVEALGTNGRPEDTSFTTVPECFRSSLAVHLMYCYWASEGWRWYIEHLEGLIDKVSSSLILSQNSLTTLQTRKVVAEKNDLDQQARRRYSTSDLLKIQDTEDKANDAIMILEANINVVISLRNFYELLPKNNAFGQATQAEMQSISDSVNAFALQVNNLINDFKMNIARANLLVRISADRKILVCS
jgi:hypothetical protein